MSLTVLLTNIRLADRSGTEVVVEQLADGLRRRGHRPIVFAQALGPLAQQLRDRGYLVSDSPHFGIRPDVIHGHHTGATMAALAAHPGVPALFLCHAAASAFDTLPAHPRIRRIMAVDELCRARLVAEGTPVQDISLLGNAIDLSRILPHPALPPRPMRAIAMTKHAAHLPAIRAACAQAGITLEEYGAGPGRIAEAPEQLFSKVDLVFATARIALEASAAGCGVIVCDGRGLAGFLTLKNAEAWRPWNLGAGVLHQPTTAQNLTAAIADWSAEEASAASQYIRAHCSIETQLDELETIYHDLASSAGPGDPEAEAAAIGNFIAQWTPHFDHQAPWRRLADQVAFPPIDSPLDALTRSTNAVAHAVAQLDSAQKAMESRLADELARTASETMNTQLAAQTHHATGVMTALAERFESARLSQQSADATVRADLQRLLAPRPSLLRRLLAAAWR
jgi:hypothetical protein